MTHMQTTNAEGIELIKTFEGCKLTVYLDAVGVPTVGYGHVTTLPVGATITQEEADNLLASDLVRFETAVSHLADIPLTQNQFAALVSFTFNVGKTNLAESTLLKKLNSGDVLGAADEFVRWNKAKGKVLSGLTRRRLAERALFRKDLAT